MLVLRGRLAPLVEEVQLASGTGLLCARDGQSRRTSIVADLVRWLDHSIPAQLLELLRRLLLDVSLDLLELPLHGLAAPLEVTHLLLFIIEWCLHYFSQQHKAQVLQLCALFVIQDSIRQHRTNLLNELLINLH